MIENTHSRPIGSSVHVIEMYQNTNKSDTNTDNNNKKDSTISSAEQSSSSSCWDIVLFVPKLIWSGISWMFERICSCFMRSAGETQNSTNVNKSSNPAESTKADNSANSTGSTNSIASDKNAEDYEGIQKYLTKRFLPIIKKGSPAEKLEALDKFEAAYPGHIGNKGVEIYVESKRKEELEAAKKKEGDKFKEAEWISQWNKDNAKAVKEKFIESFEKFKEKIVEEYIEILKEKNKPVETKQ